MDDMALAPGSLVTLTISGVQIGGDNPCRFVAEISNNHNGDIPRVLRLIEAAKAAGADFVKFQCYTPDELVELRGDGPAPEPWGAQGWTMRTLYEKAQTPHAWFPFLADKCQRVGIPWFSSVFGGESLNLLESLGCPAYKIARLDNKDQWLRAAVGGTHKPRFVSTEERVGGMPWEIPLYCPPGYPTRIEDVRLPAYFGPDFEIQHTRRLHVGLSSHCLDPRLPVAAVARGCKLIEMHFQLDDEPSELEANVSLSASQFRRMVDDVRATEAMLG